MSRFTTQIPGFDTSGYSNTAALLEQGTQNRTNSLINLAGLQSSILDSQVGNQANILNLTQQGNRDAQNFLLENQKTQLERKRNEILKQLREKELGLEADKLGLAQQNQAFQQDLAQQGLGLEKSRLDLSRDLGIQDVNLRRDKLAQDKRAEEIQAALAERGLDLRELGLKVSREESALDRQQKEDFFKLNRADRDTDRFLEMGYRDAELEIKREQLKQDAESRFFDENLKNKYYDLAEKELELKQGQIGKLDPNAFASAVLAGQNLEENDPTNILTTAGTATEANVALLARGRSLMGEQFKQFEQAAQEQRLTKKELQNLAKNLTDPEMLQGLPQIAKEKIQQLAATVSSISNFYDDIAARGMGGTTNPNVESIGLFGKVQVLPEHQQVLRQAYLSTILDITNELGQYSQ